MSSSQYTLANKSYISESFHEKDTQDTSVCPRPRLMMLLRACGQCAHVRIRKEEQKAAGNAGMVRSNSADKGGRPPPGSHQG